MFVAKDAHKDKYLIIYLSISISLEEHLKFFLRISIDKPVFNGTILFIINFNSCQFIFQMLNGNVVHVDWIQSKSRKQLSHSTFLRNVKWKKGLNCEQFAFKGIISKTENTNLLKEQSFISISCAEHSLNHCHVRWRLYVHKTEFKQHTEKKNKKPILEKYLAWQTDKIYKCLAWRRCQNSMLVFQIHSAIRMNMN